MKKIGKKPIKWHIAELRAMPIHIKTLMCLLVTVIIPVMTLVPILISYQNRVELKNMIELSTDRVKQTSEQLEMIYEEINAVSNLYFLDDDIAEILENSAKYDLEQRLIDWENIHMLQKKYNTMIPQVDVHVTVIADNNWVYSDVAYTKGISNGKIRSTWWYQQLVDNSWTTLWLKDESLDLLHGTTGLDYIYSVRMLKDFNTWETRGLLVLSFLESDLIKLYANTVPTNGSEFLLDEDGRLISMVDNANVYNDAFFNSIPKGYSTGYSQNIHGEEYIIAASTVRTTLWKVVTVTPVAQVLSGQARTKLMIPVIFLLIATLVALFTYCVLFLVVKPLQKLTQNVEKIKATKDLRGRLTRGPQDEIGTLTEEFNSLLDQVDALMDNVLREQKEKRAAELQFMYAQINPHFIYNTLASVRFLILTGENQKADTALQAFISLLRNAITTGEEFCTIEKELEILNDYISIQQLSFDEPFDVIWEIDPELKQCKTIKLSMQPIVENAILHGLKGKDGPKQLKIQCRQSGENIEFIVSDNGIGTDRQIDFNKPIRSTTKSIGLSNVQSRIRMHFGNMYGLSFTSVVSEGTSVRMLLPKIMNKSEVL